MSLPDPITRTFDGLATRVDVAGLRSVGFTSALLGEGVSTIALGTALSLAALRPNRVLLVDANWLQPALTADAKLDSSPGLAERLASGRDLGTLVRRSGRPGLAFLPIGDRAAARPTLRMLSSFLNEVLLESNEVAAHTTVVVDLPPLLAGEQFVLPWAALLDQVFVVLREAATPIPLVRQALGKLGSATPHIVLNRGAAPAGAGILEVARA